jgi:uncharacterized repeat protein (TIGR01451 family)
MALVFDVANQIWIDDSSINSGTGNYESFLRIQASTEEEGFNTDQNGNVLDNKSSFTDSIQFGSLGTVLDSQGRECILFRLDLNEQDANSSPLIALTEMQIYISGAPATLADFNAGFTGFDSVFDLNGSLDLIEHSTGSGHDDYGFLIPVSMFTAMGVTDASYVTLYSSFTGSGGGFEEWRALTDTGGGGGGNGTALIDLVKTATVGGGTADFVGEIINYTIDVSNAGTLALHNVVVTDPFVSNLAAVDLDNDTYNDGDINEDGILDLTETWHYTATHAVTQLELDAGVPIDNIAAVTTTEGATDDDVASIDVLQKPHLDVEKTGVWVDAGDMDGYATLGEQINFTVTVLNDGNVTLHGLALTDAQLGVGGLTYQMGDINSDGELDVGETWTYTGSHTIVAADFGTIIDGTPTDYAIYHNDVTADALGPQDQPATDTDGVDVNLPFAEHCFAGRTQGFWKTHVDGKKSAWDDGYTKTTSYDGVLGFATTLTVDKFLDILNTSSLASPQQNNELALAKQTVAALLNAKDADGNQNTVGTGNESAFEINDITAAVRFVYGNGVGNTGNFNSDRDGDGLRDSEELQHVLDYYNHGEQGSPYWDAAEGQVCVPSYDNHFIVTLMGQTTNNSGGRDFLSVYDQTHGWGGDPLTA